MTSISYAPLAQTREEVTELQGMVSTLIDKSRDQNPPIEPSQTD